MAGHLDIEERWPELFEPLDAAQRRSVVQAFAGIWHEGWEPNRPDVELLVDKVLGRIDREEFSRRARVMAAEHASTGR